MVEAKGTQEEGGWQSPQLKPGGPQPIQVVLREHRKKAHVGEAPVQPENPAYTGGGAKGTQEEGHVGRSSCSTEKPNLIK